MKAEPTRAFLVAPSGEVEEVDAMLVSLTEADAQAIEEFLSEVESLLSTLSPEDLDALEADLRAALGEEEAPVSEWDLMEEPVLL